MHSGPGPQRTRVLLACSLAVGLALLAFRLPMTTIPERLLPTRTTVGAPAEQPEFVDSPCAAGFIC